MMRALLILALCASAASADDGKVALLPLDSTAKLEVYGQVVASEIARVLIAGKIDVVVVLPKMAVPDHATLIVDGKISQGKGKAIALSIRVRTPNSPAIIHELEATAASLETLDKVTKELSEKVLPVLREKLVALAQKPVEPVKPPITPPITPPVAKTMPPRALLVGVGAKSPSNEVFRAALADAVPGWAAAANRAASVVEPGMLDAKTAPKTVAGSNADRAIAFEVLSYKLWGDTVPMGKARVRVRIADAGQVLFDRVVVTDTIVGENAMAIDQFAGRVAAEVLAILRPHVKRAVPAWR
jgi:hypothetical protein